MRFKGLDLNLLVAFDALLDTRNVSRAAERLNLSQSAMSAALARLRDFFHDPVLVPHGKRMHPTAFAETLLPQVRDALRQLDAVIATTTSFDPGSSRRTFRLVCSDYVTVAVMVPLITRLARIAPRIAIDLMLPGPEVGEMIDQGKIDLVISPEGYFEPVHPAELLFEERHVVAGWSGNPLLSAPIDEEAFMAAGHVAVGVGVGLTAAFADRQLESMGRMRRIDIRAPAFATVPWLLEGTNRLAVMQERLAEAMAPRFPIAIQPLPFDFPPMRQMVQYHRARAADDGLTWLRRELAQLVSMAVIKDD